MTFCYMDLPHFFSVLSPIDVHFDDLHFFFGCYEFCVKIILKIYFGWVRGEWLGCMANACLIF